MTNQATVKIEGMITQRYKPGKAGTYTVHDFVVKTANGDVKVRKFFEFNNDLIGKRVSLSASVSQYNGKEYYTVAKGTDIEVYESNSPAVETTVVATETAVKPGKRSKVTASPVLPAVSATSVANDSSFEAVHDELESARSHAEEIVALDVEYCTKLLGGKASKDAVAQLVSALQAVRATLVIQNSNKRRGW